MYTRKKTSLQATHRRQPSEGKRLRVELHVLIARPNESSVSTARISAIDGLNVYTTNVMECTLWPWMFVPKETKVRVSRYDVRHPIHDDDKEICNDDMGGGSKHQPAPPPPTKTKSLVGFQRQTSLPYPTHSLTHSP